MSVNALAGVRVIDVTHYIAGPFCTKLMGALGADVIKIEKPGEGDGARKIGPFPNDIPNPEKSGLFLYLNMNKQGITLNLKAQSGAKILKQLVEQSDVLVENFEPQMRAALGLDYEILAKINPKLVMTSISNFGQTGPYKDYKATEMTLFACGGQMHNLGDEGREPLKFGAPVSQYLAGLAGFFYTLIALHYAERTGTGQYIDLSIMECVASSHYQDLALYAYTGLVLPRFRMMGVMPCKDGFIGLNINAPQWPRLAQLVNMPDLVEDPRFQSMESRRIYADDLEALLLPWMIKHSKKEIYHAGQDAGIPVGYIAAVKDLLKSKQYQARGFFVEMDHPVAGKITYPGIPFKMNIRTPGLRRAPLLGEHNEQVYCELLGYTKEDLARLRANGII